MPEVRRRRMQRRGPGIEHVPVRLMARHRPLDRRARPAGPDQGVQLIAHGRAGWIGGPVV